MRPTEAVITLYKSSLKYGAETGLREQAALNAIAQPMSRFGVIRMQSLSERRFPRGKPVKKHLYTDQEKDNYTRWISEQSIKFFG